MDLPIKDVDRELYSRSLDPFLPSRMIDIHTHVWLKSCHSSPADSGRSQNWPTLVAEDNSVEDLTETYRLMFPGREVMPLVFGSPRKGVDLDQTNAYVRQAIAKHGLPGLLVSTPEWTPGDLEHRVQEGGFLGLKPYLSFAPAHIPAADVTIFDFLPHAHLELASAKGWIVMLHIPRPGRLRDPVNLDQLLTIERRYPGVKLVVAHIGRAYCEQDVGDALHVLADTEGMRFDFSANTNAAVMRGLLEAVGPRRVLFGSDLPILRMRMRRICENERYVNLVPPGMYGDVSGDPHMREVSAEEGARLSFFMYEELLAFRAAAESVALGPRDVEDVFYGNAARLIASAGGTLP